MLKVLRSVSFVAFDNDFDSGERAWNPEVWAAETLAILEENMVIGRLVHMDFSKDIASFGDTVNTRKPGEFHAKRKGTNDDVAVQDASAVKVPVVLNQHVHTSFMIRDGEESRSFVDLVNEYLRPAGKSLAEHVDRVLLGQVYQFRANQVASDPDGSDDIKDCILDVREKQNVKKVPMDGRNLILTPKSETEALKLDMFLSAEKVGDEGSAMREASLGRKLGYSTYQCQNTPGLSSGTSTTTAGTGSAAGDVNGVHAAGETAITLHTDASSVIKAGMYLTFEDDGGVYRVVSCGATALVIDQPLLSSLADDCAVTYYTEGDIDLTDHSGVTEYPVGYSKEINVAASGVVPQVGQLVGFADSDNDPVRSGEYCIIDVSDGGGAGDYYILLDRPLDAEVEDNDKISYGPAKQFNFAFDRNAMALVVRPLALPRSGTGANSGVASYHDLAVRVVITYDGVKQGHLVTLDMLCGVKVLDSDRGVVMVR